MHSAHRGHADLNWLRTGHHVCHFFRTAEDLSEVMVPYFKTGLERHESCLWIADDQYGTERARSDIRAVHADFDRKVATGQLEIVDEGEWYSKYGALSAAESIQLLLSRKDQAIASGQSGLRVGGYFSRLHASMWDEFLAYEQVGDKAFKGQPIAALCSYCLATCSGNAVLDVMECHGFGLAKRRGRWRPIESWSPNQGRSPSGSMRSSSKQEADLIDIIEEQLGVYLVAYPERITLNGNHVGIRSSPAERLRLVLRELVDNAVRHGALAAPEGRLAVKWRLAVNGSRRLHVAWTEHGMSGLTIPERLGQGTQVIAAAVENCMRTYQPDGMRWAFELGI